MQTEGISICLKKNIVTVLEQKTMSGYIREVQTKHEKAVLEWQTQIGSVHN